MLISLYSLLLAGSLLLSAPWWLYRMLTSDRYRHGLLERLGRMPAALRMAAQGRQVIWLHAVSVGELFAAQHLIAELQTALPNHLIALSTTTTTAQKLAQERLSAHRSKADKPSSVVIFYYPLDFAFAVRPYLRALDPKLVILMESELWPRLLHECAAAHIPVAVANARVSDRSFRRTYPWRSIWLRMGRHVSLFLAQSHETAARLEQLGIPPTRIRDPGNLKYDLGAIRRTRITQQLRSARGASRVIVAGSTLYDEEAMLLEAFPHVLRGGPDFILVIAPRHPERFETVWKQIQETKYRSIRCSRWNPDREPLAGGTILLLDTLGDLASVYSVASVAFIGGSLVPKGGHNPLEAARYGKPIVMGRSYENFREIVQAMGTIRVVDKNHLAEALISNARHGKSDGRRGRSFFESQAGATARTLDALLPLLREPQP